MVIISMSSIPIYLYLLVFALPYDSNLGVFRGIMLLTPAITFLLAAATYSWGFLPGKTDFSLDRIGHIETARIKIIQRRNQAMALASILFVLGALASMVVIVKAHL